MQEFWVYSSVERRMVAVFVERRMAEAYVTGGALCLPDTESFTILQPIKTVKGLLEKF